MESPAPMPAPSPSGQLAAPGHEADGRWAPGNQASVTNGLRAVGLQRQLVEEARQGLAAGRQALLAHLGGAESVSCVAADIAERYLVATALLGWMEGRLLAEGPLTNKGRRRALHAGYLQQLDRVTSLARLLGLEKRAKPVDPLEAVRRAVEEANAR